MTNRSPSFAYDLRKGVRSKWDLGMWTGVKSPLPNLANETGLYWGRLQLLSFFESLLPDRGHKFSFGPQIQASYPAVGSAAYAVPLLSGRLVALYFLRASSTSFVDLIFYFHFLQLSFHLPTTSVSTSGFALRINGTRPSNGVDFGATAAPYRACCQADSFCPSQYNVDVSQ